MPFRNVFIISVKPFTKELPTERCDGGKEYPPLAYKSSYWNVLHILGILLGSALAISVLTLIPRHNSILEPIYWFEINMAWAMELTLKALLMMLSCAIIT